MPPKLFVKPTDALVLSVVISLHDNWLLSSFHWWGGSLVKVIQPSVGFISNLINWRPKIELWTIPKSQVFTCMWSKALQSSVTALFVCYMQLSLCYEPVVNMGNLCRKPQMVGQPCRNGLWPENQTCQTKRVLQSIHRQCATGTRGKRGCFVIRVHPLGTTSIATVFQFEWLSGFILCSTQLCFC